jgi:hypothetical protein
LAGVGNIYSDDEILFQARIDPAERIDKLAPSELDLSILPARTDAAGLRQPFRNVHLHPHVQVASSASAEAWQPLSAQSEHRIRLRAGGQVDGDLTIEGRYVDAGVEHSVDDIDCFNPVEIATMSLKAWIVSGADHDEEVARRQPSFRRPSVARHTKRHVIFHANGDTRGQRVLVGDLPLAATLGTGRVDDDAAARAFRAGRDLLQADAALALAARELAAAVALCAGARLCAGPGT